MPHAAGLGRCGHLIGVRRRQRHRPFAIDVLSGIHGCQDDFLVVRHTHRHVTTSMSGWCTKSR